ncbi:MAG: acylneuraminate cytidylyltransferase family protein [Parcubacteria group bacterium]|nr:acylneuraminate cytidylyltransferase family protein [Parcubacteria group bacterium]
MHNITALIPVRAGSRRLKNKNILPFGDSNLLIHKIRQLKQVEGIDSIVVSSNSDEMLQMAKDEGVEVHKREEKYCDEISAPFSEVVKNICQNIEGEHILWAPCVTPLMEPRHYDEAIRIYLSDKNHDSLVSVKKFKEYLWDTGGSVNYDAGAGHVPSQNLPDMWVVFNGIFLGRREDMIQWSYWLGKNPYKYEVDKRDAIDIDDETDFEIAKHLYKKKFLS